MKLKQIEYMQRATGIVEGVAETVKDEGIKDILLVAVDLLETALADERKTSSGTIHDENAKHGTEELLHELTTHMQAVDNGFLWIHTVDGVTHFDVSCGEVESRFTYLNEKNLADVLTRLKQTE